MRKALDYETKKPLRFTQTGDGVLVHLGQVPQGVDHIVELQTKGRDRPQSGNPE